MAQACIYCGSGDVVAQLRPTGSYRYYCRYCKRLANAVHIFVSWADEYRAKGWIELPCWRCRGYGVVDIGYLEVCPDDCPECAGNGTYWVTPNGRTMDYPSGRFTGRLDKKEHEELREKYGKA